MVHLWLCSISFPLIAWFTTLEYSLSFVPPQRRASGRPFGVDNKDSSPSWEKASERSLDYATTPRLYLVARAAATSPSSNEDKDGSRLESSQQTNQTPREENCLQRFIRALAELSLLDYKWRSELFKSNEAELMLEQSLARMRGDSPSYVRPMGANENKLGPLGRWEKSTVEWLSEVIDEEGRRAKKIVNADGKLVRPKDASDDTESLGPLGFLEQKASDFLRSIQLAEEERVRTKTLRPKDMNESVRGPLGEAEVQAVRILEEIQESEKTRMKQSRSRGGEIVRPIDVPGPLGEFELAVLEIFYAEQRRAKERRQGSKSVVRPKDAKMRGPLGEAERQAYEAIQQLSDEEKNRLNSIKRILEENRPMENDRSSFLGVLETFIVGIVRAPLMITSVIRRIQELLSSEQLSTADQEILQQQKKKSEPSIDLSDEKSFQ